MQSIDYKSIYNESFTRHRTYRTEFGDIRTSFRYFSSLGLPKESIVLDVGTNIGSFVRELDAAGWSQSYGIDIADVAIEYGRKQYPEIASRLTSYAGEPIPYPEDSFDAVTMFDVIEHLAEPVKFLREIHRVLKSGGFFVFQTPNKYTNVIWEMIASRSIRNWGAEFHCSLQSYFSLHSLLREAGFSEAKIDKIGVASDFNEKKIRRALGGIGLALLRLTRFLPTPLYPNFYGVCRKK